MYSFSTCWNSYRHTDGRAMLREIRDMGFDHAELSHGIRISLLPGIFEAVDAGEMRVSSLHNFCPLPVGVMHAAPNIFKFSSSDDWERRSAVKYTLKTLDLAVRVKAPTVVLHLGCVGMHDYTHALLELIAEGQKGGRKYEKLRQEAFDKLERRKEDYVERTLETLDQVAREAMTRGIRLGIENRECLEEIPSDQDFPFLFHKFNGAPLGYWHDTGHAQIKENLDLIQHARQLEALSDRIYGFHVHDVKFPNEDHSPPGTGMIDFARLKPWVKPEHVKVFELHPKATIEEVRRGVEHLKSIWGPE